MSVHSKEVLESLIELKRELHIPDRSKDIGNHHGFEDVELKVSVGAADRDRHVVPHDLGRDHGDGLALGGVNLKRRRFVSF